MCIRLNLSLFSGIKLFPVHPIAVWEAKKKESSRSYKPGFVLHSSFDISAVPVIYLLRQLPDGSSILPSTASPQGELGRVTYVGGLHEFAAPG